LRACLRSRLRAGLQAPLLQASLLQADLQAGLPSRLQAGCLQAHLPEALQALLQVQLLQARLQARVRAGSLRSRLRRPGSGPVRPGLWQLSLDRAFSESESPRLFVAAIRNEQNESASFCSMEAPLFFPDTSRVLA
jgi:hypothetical protein